MAVKEEPDLNAPITIRIQYNDPRRTGTGNGPVIHSYKTHRDDPLRRIFLDFCDSMGLVYGTIRFLYDGSRVQEADTPNHIAMDDDDLIDAFSDQLGAGAGAGAAADPPFI